MSLDEFKALPQDLQKEYFRRLVEILHMERKIIGQMFGCSYGTVMSLMDKCGFKYPVIKGRRFKVYHNDWRNFFARDERFVNLMDSFSKAEKPAEESQKTPVEETTQASAQESAKKIPEVLSMAIRIYADSYDELISQLETMRGQPIMGKTLTIEVVKG